MRNNFKLELECPTCGTMYDIETDIDWGTQKCLIFNCEKCGKAVLTIGLHCPEDLNMPDDIAPNVYSESH